MKKLFSLFFVCILVLMPVKRSSAAFGADAAGIISFLAPYMGVLQTVSQVTGMDISEIKETAQKAIRITSDIVGTYNTSVEMVNLGSYSQEIYIQYLDGLKFVYENSAYLSDKEVEDMVALLNYAAFSTPKSSGFPKIEITAIADGALRDLPKIFKWHKDGGNTNIKDLSDLMQETQKKVRKCMYRTQSANRYINGVIYKKHYDLGLVDINRFQKKVAAKYGYNKPKMN